MNKFRRFRRKENGSVTLEAAVFMPVFILFLVFLIYMIRFSLVDIALNRATSETAKQIATQIYPAKLAADKLSGVAKSGYEEMLDGIKNNQDILTDGVVDSLGEQGANLLKSGAGKIVDQAQVAILTEVVKNNLEKEAEMNIINLDNVEVESAVLPVTSGSAKYVEIIATYELDLPIPFIEEPFILRKKAVERAWIGS